MLSELEQAFGETLILQAGVPGPRLIYAVVRREAEPQRTLWDIAAELGAAPRAAIDEARRTAEAALAECGPQAFTFSEGAMVGPWEMLQPRGQAPGGEVWSGRLSAEPTRTASLRVLPPGTGQDAGRRLRFVERSNPGLEPPHPSIARIDEADEDFGWLYTATVGLDARALAAVRAQGPLLEASALALAQGLAGSVGVIHDLGVVHGGLTPLAVLIANARTYVSDFGVSSAVLDGPHEGLRPGGRLGLLLYASPGLVAGDAARGLESRDDLHALGAIVYHAVCRAGPGDVRAQGDAPWLVEPPVSQGLKTVLSRLLSRHPDGCYPTARSVAMDLARVAEGQLPGPLPPPGQPVRGRRSPTAAPQRPVRAGEMPKPPPPPPSEADVPIEQDAPVDDAPGDDAPGEQDPEGAVEPTTRRASTNRISSVELARRRAEIGPVEPGKAGAGWPAFFVTLLLVVGGLVGGNVSAAPAGRDLARVRLAEADRKLRAPSVPWAELVATCDEAASAAASDAALAAQALALREEAEAGAAAERARLVPKGLEATPAELAPVKAQLEDLRLRCAGLPVATWIELDLARAREAIDARTWLDLGPALLHDGWAAGSVLAARQASKASDRALGELATTMAYVPGGPYVEGGKLARREPCWIGRTEVTRREYREFLASDGAAAAKDPEEPPDGDRLPAGWDGKRRSPAPDDDLPATGLDVWDALAYAKWRNAELADDATFLAAARGRAGRRFPWGDVDAGPAFANVTGALPSAAPVGCWPAGASTHGALDLVGNAEEWIVPKGGRPSHAEAIGACWSTPAPDLAAGIPHAPLDPNSRKETVGFRIMLRVAVTP